MLEFLQTGKALSVLAAIAFIGVVSKFITRNLYRRLLKDTENMAMTRNKNLKVLKQKLENTYRLNQNIVNSKAYLDKLMYDFRFLHLPLDTWNNVSHQMVILGLFAGGAGAFLSYWYRINSYYVVLYASMGALAGLFLMFLDSSFNIAQKKQKLETILLEYVDNSVFVRAARENSPRETLSRETSARERYETMADRDRKTDGERLTGRTRLAGEVQMTGKNRPLFAAEDREEIVRENEIKDGLVHEETPRRAPIRSLRSRNSKAEDLLRTVRSMKDDEEAPASLARRDIDSLKESLEQIAASRDRTREDMPRGADGPENRDWTKNISEEEMKLIGEIMRQYFSKNSK